LEIFLSFGLFFLNFIYIHASHGASLLMVVALAVINLPQLEIGFNLGRELDQTFLQLFDRLLRFVLFID
jgi:hypothetical protein